MNLESQGGIRQGPSVGQNTPGRPLRSDDVCRNVSGESSVLTGKKTRHSYCTPEAETWNASTVLPVDGREFQSSLQNNMEPNYVIGQFFSSFEKIGQDGIDDEDGPEARKANGGQFPGVPRGDWLSVVLDQSTDMLKAGELRLQLHQQQWKAIPAAQQTRQAQRAKASVTKVKKPQASSRTKRSAQTALHGREATLARITILEDYGHQLRVLDQRMAENSRACELEREKSHKAEAQARVVLSEAEIQRLNVKTVSKDAQEDHDSRSSIETSSEESIDSTSTGSFRESVAARRWHGILDLRDHPILTLRGGAGTVGSRSHSHSGDKPGRNAGGGISATGSTISDGNEDVGEEEEELEELEYDDRDGGSEENEDGNNEGDDRDWQNLEDLGSRLAPDDESDTRTRRDNLLRDYQLHLQQVESEGGPFKVGQAAHGSQYTWPMLEIRSIMEQHSSQIPPPEHPTKRKNMDEEKRRDLAEYLTDNGTVQKEFRAAELFDAQPPWEDFKRRKSNEDVRTWIRRHSSEGFGSGGNKSNNPKVAMATFQHAPTNFKSEIKSQEESAKGGFLNPISSSKSNNKPQNESMATRRRQAPEEELQQGGNDSSSGMEPGWKGKEKELEGHGIVSASREQATSEPYEAMRRSQSEQNSDALENVMREVKWLEQQQKVASQHDEYIPSFAQQSNAGARLSHSDEPYKLQDALQKQQSATDKTLAGYRQQLQFVQEADERRTRQASEREKDEKEE